MTYKLMKWIKYFTAPILASLFPIIVLAANNIHEINVVDSSRSIFSGTLLAILAFLVARLVVRDSYRAALIISLALLMFYSYGHLREIFKSIPLTTLTLGRHRYLSFLFAFIFCAWSWFVLRRIGAPQRWVNQAIAMGAFGLIYPILTIGIAVLPLELEKFTYNLNNDALSSPNQPDFPDIYYIILDGYGRADILEELYNFDNNVFLSDLEECGFFVADESISNYNTTRLSLASSLNFDYVQSIVEDKSLSLSQRSTEALIWNNQVSNFLAHFGYETVTFDSGRPWSSITNADHYFEVQGDQSLNDVLPRTTVLNLFETMLFKTTFLSVIDDGTELFGHFNRTESAGRNEEHRIRILFGLQKLEEIPGWQGNFFTFLHTLSPHPPFIFGPNGERVDSGLPFTFGDGSNYMEMATRQDYIEGYIDQLQYINTLVLRTVDTILRNSSTPPIIILQGDHGPGAYLDWPSMENSNILERHGILNAIYFPQSQTTSFYPSITPVNTFRLILGEQFNGEFELLPDQAYFTEKRGGVVDYDLEEVTYIIK